MDLFAYELSALSPQHQPNMDTKILEILLRMKTQIKHMDKYRAEMAHGDQGASHPEGTSFSIFPHERHCAFSMCQSFLFFWGSPSVWQLSACIKYLCWHTPEKALQYHQMNQHSKCSSKLCPRTHIQNMYLETQCTSQHLKCTTGRQAVRWRINMLVGKGVDKYNQKLIPCALR